MTNFVFADLPSWEEKEDIVEKTQNNTDCSLNEDQKSWFYSDLATGHKSWFNSDLAEQVSKVGKITEDDSTN